MQTKTPPLELLYDAVKSNQEFRTPLVVFNIKDDKWEIGRLDEMLQYVILSQTDNCFAIVRDETWYIFSKPQLIEKHRLG